MWVADKDFWDYQADFQKLPSLKDYLEEKAQSFMVDYEAIKAKQDKQENEVGIPIALA
jgi:hypothetical protein